MDFSKRSAYSQPSMNNSYIWKGFQVMIIAS